MRASIVAVVLAALLAGCASRDVRFENATPRMPVEISAIEIRPEGAGPFPAVVLLHGCHGVGPSMHAWAEWFRERRYVALIVDSWTPRGLKREDLCTPRGDDIPSTARFDDGVGALRYLHSRPYVDRERIGVIGFSNGGVFSIALVNGPSHERARRRGVTVPPPGYRAAVGLYPGGCFSLVDELVVRPLLILMGDADDWTSPPACVAMVENMRRHGADATIVLYPGAWHYFDVEGLPRTWLPDVQNRNRPGECCGATVGFDPVAAADARRRIEAFFGYHLNAR